MARTVLVQLGPRDPATGTVIPLRLAGGGSTAYRQLNFTDWRAGITNEPRYKTGIGVDQSGMTGSALPQAAGMRFFPADTALLTTVADLFWTNATIQVNIGDDENPGETYPIAMKGMVSDVTVDGGAIVLTFADLSLSLNKPVAPNVFAGTGDLEGSADATGRVKRRTFGSVFNVEGLLFDKAYNIYEFGDPSHPLASIPAIKDKGRASDTNTVLAWQGTALATLQALRNATVPSGGAVLAPSIACAKWWTVPAGPLTADLKGEDQLSTPTVPTLVQYLLSVFAPTMAITNMADTQAFQSGVAGVHVDDGSETAANLLDRLCLPVSLAWVVNGDGTLTFRRLTWDGPVINLAAREIARETVFSPLRYRRVGFQRNYRQQSDSEIAASLITSTDVTYQDGTPIEVLKPAQGGADKTSTNTASAIFGQGPGATAAGSAVLNDYGTALSTTNRVKFSRFEKKGLGWGPNNPFNLATNYYITDVFQGLNYIQYDLQATAPNQYCSVYTDRIQVTAGERICVQARMQCDNGSARQLSVKFYDINGSEIQNVDKYVAGNAGISDPASLVFNFLVAPANAIYCVVHFWAYSSGAGRFNTTVANPMVSTANANQTTPPPFTPGPNSVDGSDPTNQNTAAAVSGQGALATLNQAGYNQINVADLQSTGQVTSGNTNNASGQQGGTAGAIAATDFSGQLAVKGGGVYYFLLDIANATSTNGGITANFNSIQILDSGGNVILDKQLPFGGPAPSSRLSNLFILAINPRTFAETVTWRVVCRGGGGGYTSFGNGTVQAVWKAI